MTTETPQKQNKQVALSVIVGAIIAAGGSSGFTIYMSPDVKNDVNARADPYTGTMHKEFALRISERLKGLDKSIVGIHQHIASDRADHRDVHKREAEYLATLLKFVGKTQIKD